VPAAVFPDRSRWRKGRESGAEEDRHGEGERERKTNRQTGRQTDIDMGVRQARGIKTQKGQTQGEICESKT